MRTRDNPYMLGVIALFGFTAVMVAIKSAKMQKKTEAEGEAVP